MANNSSWGKSRGFFEVSFVFTTLHGKSLARCLILLPTLSSVPSLHSCLPQPSSPASCPHGGQVLERAVVGSLPLHLSFPQGTALLLQSWVNGDWNSRPPRIWPQTFFPNLFPTRPQTSPSLSPHWTAHMRKERKNH